MNRFAFIPLLALPVRRYSHHQRFSTQTPTPTAFRPAKRCKAPWQPRITPRASQSSTPPSKSTPRVTALAVLLLLSTTLWSLVLLPAILLLRLLNRQNSIIHLTRLALLNSLRTVGIRVTLRQRENLPPTPCLVVANHQSPLDIFALACLNTPLISVLPARVADIPFVGWLIRLADWVLIKGADRRSQMDSLKKIDERLDAASVAVFPEGKPSETGEVGKFASPIFKAAKKKGVKIVPVTVHGGIGIGGFLPERWGKYEVSVHEPMDIGDMTDKEAAEEARRIVVSGLPEELRS